MQASDIKVGSYYVTSTNQVRKVEGLKDDRVSYRTRGKKFVPDDEMGYGPTLGPTIEAFAEQVDREVTSDWDPDYPERKPADSK